MKLDIIEKNGNIVAYLEGRLDTAASSQFARDIEPLIDAASKEITLDCSKLQFISSSGLRLFLTLRKATISKGGEVIITGASDDVMKVFSITGFSTLFKFL